MIVAAWFVLHIGSLFTPGLLDDVDSIYIEIARSMLLRHDYVSPYIDGIRFFDKPPLMYWLAAGSMHLFGATDWPCCWRSMPSACASSRTSLPPTIATAAHSTRHWLWPPASARSSTPDFSFQTF
jgi:4-amino-4-deoxy-L-arabinose transferase-like glycosyltransferase